MSKKENNDKNKYMTKKCEHKWEIERIVPIDSSIQTTAIARGIKEWQIK